MRSYILIALVAVFALASCKSPENPVLSSTKVNGNKIPVIHFDNVTGDPVETKLSDIISDFEIIVLETLDECLIQSINELAFYDDKVLLATQRFPDPAPVFMFERNGKFVKEVGKGGRGPGEHTGYMVISIRAGDMIQINFMDKIQVFDKEGNLKGELSEPMELMSDSYYLGPDLYFSTGSITNYPIYPRDSVMIVFHDMQGKIISRIPRPEYPPSGSESFTPSGWNHSIYRYDDKWNLFMESIDTLFSLDGMKLSPRVIFDLGTKRQKYNETMDPKRLIGLYSFKLEAETDNYWLFRNGEITRAEVRQYRGAWGGTYDFRRELVFVGKKDGEALKIKLVDDIWELTEERRLNDFSDILDNNKLLVQLQAPEIKNKISEKLQDQELNPEVKKRLEDLDKRIDDNSNPVIFVYHLKQEL